MRRLKTFRVGLVCEPRDRYGHADGPEAAVGIARAILEREGDGDKENFLLLAMNARGQVTGYKVVGVGTMTASLVHPREVFRAALALEAVTVLVVHNHPSGDPTPSDEDRELTQRLKKAGEIIGIPVVDHIVLGDGEWSSAEHEVTS